jgi:hypothetical protein
MFGHPLMTGPTQGFKTGLVEQAVPVASGHVVNLG